MKNYRARVWLCLSVLAVLISSISHASLVPTVQVPAKFDELPLAVLKNILDYLPWKAPLTFRLINKTIAHHFDVYDENNQEKDVTEIAQLPLIIGSFLRPQQLLYWKQLLFKSENLPTFLRKHRFDIKFSYFAFCREEQKKYVKLERIFKDFLISSLSKKSKSYAMNKLKLFDDIFHGAEKRLPFEDITSLTVKKPFSRKFGFVPAGYQAKRFSTFCIQNPLENLILKTLDFQPKTIEAILEKSKSLKSLHLPKNFRFELIKPELLKKIPALYVWLDNKKAINLNARTLNELSIDPEVLEDLPAVLTYLSSNYPFVKKFIFRNVSSSQLNLMLSHLPHIQELFLENFYSDGSDQALLEKIPTVRGHPYAIDKINGEKVPSTWGTRFYERFGRQFEGLLWHCRIRILNAVHGVHGVVGKAEEFFLGEAGRTLFVAGLLYGGTYATYKTFFWISQSIRQPFHHNAPLPPLLNPGTPFSAFAPGHEQHNTCYSPLKPSHFIRNLK